MTRPPLWGLMLAGGRSRRFGRDKASVQIEGEAALQRLARLMAAEVSELRVSIRRDQANDPMRRQFQQITDSPGVGGPAAGLLGAHAQHPDVAWLTVACDLPLLDARGLAQLVAAREPDASATVCTGDDGELEPLCAIYEPEALAGFARWIETGRGVSPKAYLETCRPARVSLTAGMLLNMNAPGDLPAPTPRDSRDKGLNG